MPTIPIPASLGERDRPSRVLRRRRPFNSGHRHRRWRAAVALTWVAALVAPAASIGSETAAIGRARAEEPAAVGLAGARGVTKVGFWAGEAVPGTDWNDPATYWNARDTRLYTARVWEVLHRHGIPLFFNLRYRRDFGPVPPGMPRRGDGLALLRAANRHEVPVWGWVVIPFSDGYWAWEGAAAESLRAVRALTAWTRERQIALRGLVLDFESPVGTTLETNSAILRQDAGPELPSVLTQAIDPLGQCLAWRGYSRIAVWARRHQIRLAATPAPTALDDLGDGTMALQDAAQFIVPKAPWDVLFFQVYRSVFSYYLGRDPGPEIINSYLRSARRAYGASGQVSLGSAGRGAYRRLSALVHDVRLAATLGARIVPIYSLERALRAYGGPRALATLAEAGRHPLTAPQAARATTPTAEARALRAGVHRLDVAAGRATPAITAAAGRSMAANSWADPCRPGRRLNPAR